VPLRVVALVGPTGTGKTEVAARVARRSGAEVISCDSMQVYRGMDIGTAKPSPALREELPHHLLDVVEPDDPMSAGRYAELAREAARAIAARDRPVLLVGGTGLYARAFAGGLLSGVSSDPGVRAELEQRETADLFAELRDVDPRAAREIEPGDRVRIVRALEIYRQSGETASLKRAEHEFSDRPFDVHWIGLDRAREEVEARIRARVETMFAAGFVEEVRALHAAGYGPELRALQSIGYKQVAELIAGSCDEAEARERIAVATRRYAKRQRTWFRAEPGLRWIDASSGDAAVEAALASLR